MKDETQIWEMQPMETAKSFNAFKIYRDLGPERSLLKARQKLGKNRTTITEWSSKFSWVERAAAYDKYLDEQIRIMLKEQLKETIKKHLELAGMFQDKIKQRLQSINIADISPANLIRWFDISVKIERLCLGESTEIIKQEEQFKENNRDNIMDGIMDDPVAQELSLQLFERLTLNEEDFNRMQEIREKRKNGTLKNF